MNKTKNLLKLASTPRWIVLCLDLLISLIALGIAYLVRFDFYALSKNIFKEWSYIQTALPFFLMVKLLSFYFFKIHRGLVRHTSVEDVKRIFISLVCASSCLLIIGILKYFFIDGSFLFPTSIVIVEFSISLLLMIGLRFMIKVFFYELSKTKEKKHIKVLIYGAGDYGIIVKRTIEGSSDFNYKVVAFIDEKRSLDKTRIEGTEVIHSSKLHRVITENDIDELIVAIQSPNKRNISRVAEICLNYCVTVKRVPSVYNWINGEFSINQVRKINIEDLLGRDPISLNLEDIQRELTNNIILVTGAAGSIGSEIVRQVIQYKPQKLILLDQWESGLYDLQIDLEAQGFKNLIEVVIGDVRDYQRMRNIFKQLKPIIVFHAAAYKHVPLMENNPSESIKTNVLGTKNIVDLADEFEVSKMVIISTDKAVNPTNVMGASKRIAEIYAQTKSHSSKTQYVTTRFGNVLGSNGSVIPLFKKQIENGGPITVTDENVTRYFMTIPEACQLVLEAGVMGKGGEIFVFDMGKPMKIVDLAKKMVQLSGLVLNKDIGIKIIGLRPGEKLYEELLADEENTLSTIHPQILKAKSIETSPLVLEEINQLIKLFDKQNNVEIVQKMKQIVPEYVSNNSQYTKLDHK